MTVDKKGILKHYVCADHLYFQILCTLKESLVKTKYFTKNT